MLRPRVLIYTGVLIVLVGIFIGGLAMHKPIELNVMRDRRVLSREIPGGLLENAYQVELMNASDAPRRVRFAVEGLPGVSILKPHDAVEIGASDNLLRPLEITVPTDEAHKGVYKIVITARSDESKPVVVHTGTTFLVP